MGFFDDPDTKEVIHTIAAAPRLTIFTGAGVLADLEIPNWSTLIVRLLEKLEHSNPADASGRSVTAQFAVDFFHQLPTASIVDALYGERYPNGKRRQAINTRNKDIAAILYPTKKARSANPAVSDDALALYVLRLAIAKRLAGCDVHIVTTNYDDSLEQIAATSREKTFGDLGVKVFTNWDHNARGPLDGVPVTHLHGLIPRTGRAQDVVFSEQDYIEWDQRSTWRDYLGARLSNDGVTLFVGASLRDYNIAAMIHRFGNNVYYALLPLEEDVSYAVKREASWPALTARYAALRGVHLGIRVLRPDFFGQVCQFLNEATIHPELGVPDPAFHSCRPFWSA